MEKNYYTLKLSLLSEVNSKKFTWLLLLLVSFCANSINAQTSCATATPVTINGTCILNDIVSDGTQDAPAVTCPGTFRRERWYTFTVAGGMTNVTITASASNNNLLLQLISSAASCTGLAQVLCTNATNSNSAQTESISTPLNNGIYYIKVVNVGFNSDMNLTSLCVTAPPTITSFGSTSGCVGSSITINGTNLTGVTAANVKIGGTPVSSITSNTATSIVAIIGTGTTGTVSVTNLGGTATSATTFTVNQLPVVSAPASVCVGNTIQLSPATGGTWTSSNPSLASVDNTGLASGLVAGSVTFTFTNATTLCSKTTNAVNVYALPVVSAPGAVCVGNTIQLSPSTGGTWTSSNSSIASVTNTGIVSGITAGSVLFTFTNTTTNCSATTTPVTVNALPAVSAPTSVCVGSTIQLSPSSGGIWTSSNPALASVDNTGQVSGLAAGSVAFSFTDSTTNCSKTTASVTVNALPVLGGPTQVCIGNTIQLTPSTGGTWTSNNPAIASIDNTGLVSGLAAGSTTFTFTDATTNCSTTSAAITVNNLPVVSAPAAVCVGSTIQLSPATGGTWISGNPSLATVTNAGVVSGVAAGSVGFTYTSSTTNCSATTTSVTVNALPVVSAPASVCIGNSIQLSPSTGGTWTSSNPSLASVDNTGLVSALAGGSVSFTFTDSTTNCSNTTSAVTINIPPAITVQPAITQSLCSGNSASLSIIATGSGLTYQWFKGAAPLANSGSISGTTTATLSFNAITSSDAASDYYCVVTGSCGVLPSNNAAIIVSQPVVILTQPITSQTLCVGDSAAFSVTASGDGLTYQWYKGVNAITDGGTISGALTATLTINSITAADAAANYHCIVSGISPCSSGSSNNSALIVNLAPAIITQPSPRQTICTGAMASFSVSATGGNLLYQWYKGATLLTNGGNISGATTATLTINPISSADVASDYYCEVTNGCASATISNNAELIISPIAVIPSQSLTVCSGVAFSFAPVNGMPTAATIVPSNTNYSWSAPSVTGGITGGAILNNQTVITGTLVNPTNVDQTATYTITPRSGALLCTGAPFTLVVTVKPSAKITNLSTTICSGDTFTIVPSNGGGNVIPAGTLYTWNDPVVTGGITGGASGSGLSSIGFTLTNPTTSTQTATYTINTLSGSCAGNAFTITVSVNPKPIASVNIASQTTCSDVANTPILVSNAVNAATTYTWTRDNTGNVTGIASGTSTTIAAGNSYSISNALTNATGVVQTVIYTITPTTNGCVGSPVTATVIVSPPTVRGAVTVSLPNVTPAVNTITVCHFASGMLYLSGYTGNIVRWESTTNGGVTWTPIANTSDTYNYVNVTQTTIYRAVIQNESWCTAMYSNVSMVNVIPNIKPTPVSATPAVICAGDSSDLFSQSGYATNSYIASGGTFSNANPANWLVDGCGNCLSAGASNTNPGPFQLSATNGGTYSGINYTSVGKFAIANGNFNSIMQTPVFNTFGLNALTLSFNHAFNLLAGATATVELSLDGGATYTVVLAQWSGPSTRTPYTAFPLTTIDMSTYLGQSNLKIRFVYHGTVGSSWAIDNIILPEAPSNLTTQWVDAASGVVLSNAATLTVTPTVTTTYAVTSYLNGCTSYGPEGTTYVTVTVNQRPTASIGPSQTVCFGGTATFNVALTGSAPWRVTYSNGTTTTTVNNVTTNPYIFSVANVTANATYTITGLSDSKCTAKPADLTGAAVVTVLNGTKGLWTGLVSTDWFDCKNWAGGLPSSTIDAVIPNGTPRMPLIDPSTSPYAASYSNIASARDVIIGTSATVTMVSGSTSELQVSRDWKNSGTFAPGTGTVTFNGSASNQVQTINVGINTQETFYNVNINTTNGAKGVSVVDGFALTVSNNLTLQSGDLRLTGEAQLIQSGLTANPIAGTGKLLRDQQGTRSSFNYNYWSSPVSVDNLNYTVGSVLFDGTDVTTSPFAASPITFTLGVYSADGPLSNPIKISTSWIYKYTAISTSYFSWQSIGSTGSVKVGEGFTMKGTDGTANATDLQNYVFAGKPNNGNINLSIALSQGYLIGNPYPSALNADSFIKDNIKDGGNATSNVFNGALYFWDHFGGHTHLLAGYVGGYATYTLMGGVVAIANDPLNINDGSTGVKVPSKYIPVGQGFFIRTDLDSSVAANLVSPITGGTVAFRNSQRAFKIESAGNSVFFRTSGATTTNEEDKRPKIILKFDSPSGFHRQLLVGADVNASAQFDLGYDAPMIDVASDDMYWESGNSKLVIQAISDFNAETVIPLGVVVGSTGISTIRIQSIANIPDETNIYLFDAESGIYHDIRNAEFAISLPVGQYHNRFSIRFTNTTLEVNDINLSNGVTMVFTNGNNALNIANKNPDINIKSVTLFNLLGQTIRTWEVSNLSQHEMRIQFPNISSGTYIVKIKTNVGESSKKIIVR